MSAAWLALPLLLASAARGTGAKQMIEFNFVVKSCVPTANSEDREGYAEHRLTATISTVRGGALLESVGAEFSALPLIYAGPIRKRPEGLWVGVTLGDAVPKAGQRWTARCAAPGSGPASAARLLSGLGNGCSLTLAKSRSQNL